MGKKLNSSSFVGKTSVATAAVLALTMFFNPAAGLAADAKKGPAFSRGTQPPKAVVPTPGQNNSPVPTFEQRAGTGLLDMMSEGDLIAVPVAKWKKMLPPIIDHGQYNLIPKVIEAQIPVSFYYSEPMRVDGNLVSSNLVEGLINTGQLHFAREELRHSIKPEMLTNASGNDYTLMVEIFRNGEWKSLSDRTRNALASNVDLWVKPMALYPSVWMARGGISDVKQEALPLVSIAMRYGNYDDVPESITKAMVSHSQWDQVKMQYLRTAAETAQLQRLTPATWNTYESKDILDRYAKSNVIDLAAQAGQAHIIPGKFWTAMGVKPFTTPHPRTGIPPLYFIARATDSARNLDQEQKIVLRQATKADWLADYRSREGASDVWKNLTRDEIMAVHDNKDEENDQDDGLRLGDWISNAGKIDLVRDKLSPADIADLAPRNSLGAQVSEWKARSPLFVAMDGGGFEGTKWESMASDNYILAMEDLYLDSVFGDLDNNFSPLLWVAVNKADDIVGDHVWKALTHDDVKKYHYNGGHSLADLIANAGQADRIKHLLNEKEIANLPKPGSIGADPSSWLEVKALEQELQKGIVIKDHWLAQNPYGRTYLHAYLRNVPAFGMVEKLLPNFSLSELMIRDDKKEFALLSVADNGFLKYLSAGVWDEILKKPEVMTEQGAVGRFVLNIVAKDRSYNQLVSMPRNVMNVLPRRAFFVRDDLGGFPFHWAHFTGQEDALPWGRGIFKPQDMLIEAPSKSVALAHISDREQKMRILKMLGPDSVGPVGKMLSRLPFETWRMADESGETALLQLTRNGSLSRMPKDGFLDRIEARDLESGGRYGDSVLYWLAGSHYQTISGTQVIWNHALDLVNPEAVAAVRPEVWTARVHGPAADDPAVVSDNTRYALERGDFPLLRIISSGYLPPPEFEWRADAYTTQDSNGNDVARELYVHGKFNLDRVHDLARLGLLDKDKVPPYVIVDVNKGLKSDEERVETWLYKPPGKLNSIFAEAANNGLVEALDWSDDRQTVRRAIPVEAWYEKGAEGKVPAVEMIKRGKMYEIPATYLYESPQMWSPELLKEVYDPANWRDVGASNMLHLWTQQVDYIADELQGASNELDAAKSDDEKRRLQEYLSMLKSRDAMYREFRPQFEKNYNGALDSSGPLQAPQP